MTKGAARFRLAKNHRNRICAKSQAPPAAGKPEAHAHDEKDANQCAHGLGFSTRRYGGKPPITSSHELRSVLANPSKSRIR